MRVSIKQQRAEALVYMNQHRWVRVAVHFITQTGSVPKAKNKFIAVVESFKDHSDFVAPTKEEWEKGKELAQLYKADVSGRGRAPASLSGREQGALTVWKQTGYVAYQGSNHSVLWHCACDCGEVVTITAHNLKRKAYCCGLDSCPYKVALTQAQAHRRDTQDPLAPNKILGITMEERKYVMPPPRATQDTADMLVNNITGSMSTELD